MKIMLERIYIVKNKSIKIHFINNGSIHIHQKYVHIFKRKTYMKNILENFIENMYIKFRKKVLRRSTAGSGRG